MTDATTHTPPGGRARHPGAWVAIAVIAYVVAALLWTLPEWLSPHRLVGETADALQWAWATEWVPFALSHGLNPLYTTYLNAPHGWSTLWPEPPFLYDLAVWPATALWGPGAGYNLTTVLAIASSAAACFALLGRWTSRTWMRLAGGAGFAFCPYVVSEAAAGHPTLMAVAAVPLMLLVLDEMWVRQRWRPRTVGLLLGLVGLAQLLTAEEVLVDGVIVAILGEVTLWVTNCGLGGRSWSYAARAGAWALWAAPPALALVAYQMLGPGAIHGRVLPSATWSAPAASLLLPTSEQFLTAPAISAYVYSAFGQAAELGTYVGVPMLAILGWTSFRFSDVRSRWLVTMVLLLMVLTLGPSASLMVIHHHVHVPLPEALLAHVPLVGDLLPVRLAVFLDLFCVLLAVHWIEHVLPGRQRVPALVLAAVTIVAWIPVLTANSLTLATPAFFVKAAAGTAARAGETDLILPYAWGPGAAYAMLWQASSDMRFRMPEGYGTRKPWGSGGNVDGPSLRGFASTLVSLEAHGAAPDLNAARRQRGIRYLAHDQIRQVVLVPSPHALATKAYITQLLGHPPVVTGGVWLWRLG